jgi:ubiquinone/menaquinone biosynthesis C-methylase UbiE
VNAFFESSADYWKDIYAERSLLPTIYQARLNTALDWIAALELGWDARILEVGTGAGQIPVALARGGFRVDAVDPAPAMLQMAREYAVSEGVHDQVRLCLADVHDLPFESRTFDLVIAIGVIPWLHSEASALQEMRRVLQDGGYLLVTADNNARLNRLLEPLSSPLFALFRVVAKRLLQVCGLLPENTGFQPKRHYPHELNRLMRSCHFAPLKSCTLGFGPFTVFRRELFRGAAAVRMHYRLQKLASHRWSPLRWSGSQYVVMAAARQKSG